MRRRLPALIAAVTVGLLALSGSASAAPYVPAPGPVAGFYSVPYGPDLYWVQQLPGGGHHLNLASYADWRSQGFPAPTPITEVRYDRAPWSPTIIAAPRIPSWPTSVSETHALTFAEWARVGYPSPTVTWTPAGVYYRSYRNSPAIYAFSAAGPHRLTFAQWQASGFPAAYQEALAPGTRLWRWSNAPEIFMELDGVTRTLTFAQWASYGYPTPDVLGPKPTS